jgi:hypothetical protein
LVFVLSGVAFAESTLFGFEDSGLCPKHTEVEQVTERERSATEITFFMA